MEGRYVDAVIHSQATAIHQVYVFIKAFRIKVREGSAPSFLSPHHFSPATWCHVKARNTIMGICGEDGR